MIWALCHGRASSPAGVRSPMTGSLVGGLPGGREDPLDWLSLSNLKLRNSNTTPGPQGEFPGTASHSAPVRTALEPASLAQSCAPSPKPAATFCRAKPVVQPNCHSAPPSATQPHLNTPLHSEPVNLRGADKTPGRRRRRSLWAAATHPSRIPTLH